jgi:hypothetical protein
MSFPSKSLNYSALLHSVKFFFYGKAKGTASPLAFIHVALQGERDTEPEEQSSGLSGQSGSCQD